MRGRKVYVRFLSNHESSMRPPNSVVRKVTRRVFDIYFGLKVSLSIGNAVVIKVWMWANDAIGKYVHDYALACGEVVGISLEDYLIENPDYEAEYSTLVSHSKKISSFGCNPEFNVKNLVKKMIETEISSWQL